VDNLQWCTYRALLTCFLSKETTRRNYRGAAADGGDAIALRVQLVDSLSTVVRLHSSARPPLQYRIVGSVDTDRSPTTFLRFRDTLYIACRGTSYVFNAVADLQVGLRRVNAGDLLPRTARVHTGFLLTVDDLKKPVLGNTPRASQRSFIVATAWAVPWPNCSASPTPTTDETPNKKIGTSPTSSRPGLTPDAPVCPVGTAEFTAGPAMSAAAAAAAEAVGAAVIAWLVAIHGATVEALGEVGIGNTTAAAAVLGALMCAPPAAVVGRGTGVGVAGLADKTAAVTDGLARQPEAVATAATDPRGAEPEDEGLGSLLADAPLRQPHYAAALVTAVRRPGGDRQRRRLGRVVGLDAAEKLPTAQVCHLYKAAVAAPRHVSTRVTRPGASRAATAVAAMRATSRSVPRGACRPLLLCCSCSLLGSFSSFPPYYRWRGAF